MRRGGMTWLRGNIIIDQVSILLALFVIGVTSRNPGGGNGSGGGTIQGYPHHYSNQSSTNKHTSPHLHTMEEDGDIPINSVPNPPLRKHGTIMKSYNSHLLGGMGKGMMMPGQGQYLNGNNLPHHLQYPISALDPYYEDYYERPSTPARQFSARSVSSAQFRGTLPVVQNPSATTLDTEFAASDHGHSGGGGGGGGGNGWGWGWGWGWPSHGGLDNSLGLLGLLGLLSLLSNVLNLLASSTTNTNNGRKRREVLGGGVPPSSDPFPELRLKNHQRLEYVCQKLLPSLNIIGHISDKRIPVNCSHQEVCKTNKMLVKEFDEAQGRSIARMLSSAIIKLLKEVDNSSPLRKDLKEAGIAGAEGKECEELYPTCPFLMEKGRDHFPPLLSPQHVTSIVIHKRIPVLKPTTN